MASNLFAVRAVLQKKEEGNNVIQGVSHCYLRSFDVYVLMSEFVLINKICCEECRFIKLDGAATTDNNSYYDEFTSVVVPDLK